MIRRVYHIEFLTPCFCAGADQKSAELRAAAIRGQLRWWFRCLGGSPAEERTAFGGVHGDQPAASTLAVRVIRQPEGGQKDWHTKIRQQGVAPGAYLLGFFCGRTGRLNPNGALPPGSEATVEVLFKRPPTAELELAVQVFFSIGALGFRATRGAGALTSSEHALTQESWKGLVDKLQVAGFHVALLDDNFEDWVRMLTNAEEILKNKLRGRNGLGLSAGRNGARANALGSAKPRQASVLHLRPVRIDGKLRLVLLEAPHQRILGVEALQAHGNRGSIVGLARKIGIALL
jgi:hypothetical protein